MINGNKSGALNYATSKWFSPDRSKTQPALRFAVSAAFFLWSVTLFSQTWTWAKGEGDIGNDASNAITLDDNGNAYITGSFAGRADFSGTFYQGRGIYEFFIAKYDPQGNLIWVKSGGGADNDQGNAIKYSNNFIYVTGFFNDTAWFETTRLASRGDADAFTAKYDLDGNLKWIKQAGGTGFDYGAAIDVDQGGNIFIAGSYEYAMSLDTVHLSTTNLYKESFYAKYDNSGNLLWAKSTLGNNSNQITGIAFDQNHSVFLTGYFGGSFKIADSTINSSSSSYDIFLAKVDVDANLKWIKRAGSNYEDGANAVCSDKNGNPSITGYFAHTAYFDNNSVTYSDYNDVFVARYDSSGHNLWVKAGKGHQLDLGFGITADNNGNIFATGMFEDVINFDGNVLNAAAGSDRDIFLLSYDQNGNIRWITKAGDIDTDCGLGLAISNSGIVALTGYYLHTCFFGSIQVDYANGNDLFIAEYNPPLVNGIEEVDKGLAFSIYPNPAGNFLYVEFNTFSNSVIRICDSRGRILTELKSAGSMAEINTAELADGIYLLCAENHGVIVWKKFVVAH